MKQHTNTLLKAGFIILGLSSITLAAHARDSLEALRTDLTGLQSRVSAIPAGTPGTNGRDGEAGPAGPAGPQGIAGAKLTSGVVLGDMLYWDGAKWALIPVPNHMPVRTAFATLHYCNNGIPTWEPSCTPPNGLYKIGDIGQAGGIVFYITEGGLHGLEAAPVDQSAPLKPSWGCMGTVIAGAYGAAVGTGSDNTTAIVTGCIESNIAASLANGYVLNGYSDWYLPSLLELDELYKQKNVVGNFIYGSYWSSSEYDASASWVESFASGSQYWDLKNSGSGVPSGYSVRSIRSF